MRICLTSAHIVVSIGLSAALAACSMGRGPDADTAAHVERQQPRKAVLADPKIAVASGFEVVEENDPTVSAVPDRQVLEAHAEMIRGGGRYWVGQPYEVAGKVYEPQENPAYDELGLASWYGGPFHGRLTANGEIFDRTGITAAHPTMPLPSYVRVTNLNNERSIIVRVNDRGPFRDDRLIDVSEQTASLLGFRRHGLTRVRVEYVGKAPLAGEDKSELIATYQGPPPERPRLLLASATPAMPAMPLTPNIVAFAPKPSPRPAAAAIQTLSAAVPAAERIQIAFQAAAEAEE